MSLPTSTDWELVEAADLDADGRDELLLRHSSSGSFRSYQMGPSVERKLVRGLFTDPIWKFERSGNFDEDVEREILMRHRETGEWYLFDFVDASQKYAPIPARLSTNLSWHLVQVSDLGNDNKDDLLFRNRETGQWLGYETVNSSAGAQRFHRRLGFKSPPINPNFVHSASLPRARPGVFLVADDTGDFDVYESVGSTLDYLSPSDGDGLRSVYLEGLAGAMVDPIAEELVKQLPATAARSVATSVSSGLSVYSWSKLATSFLSAVGVYPSVHLVLLRYEDGVPIVESDNRLSRSRSAPNAYVLPVLVITTPNTQFTNPGPLELSIHAGTVPLPGFDLNGVPLPVGASTYDWLPPYVPLLDTDTITLSLPLVPFEPDKVYFAIPRMSGELSFLQSTRPVIARGDGDCPYLRFYLPGHGADCVGLRIDQDALEIDSGTEVVGAVGGVLSLRHGGAYEFVVRRNQLFSDFLIGNSQVIVELEHYRSPLKLLCSYHRGGSVVLWHTRQADEVCEFLTWSPSIGYTVRPWYFEYDDSSVDWVPNSALFTQSSGLLDMAPDGVVQLSNHVRCGSSEVQVSTSEGDELIMKTAIVSTNEFGETAKGSCAQRAAEQQLEDVVVTSPDPQVTVFDDRAIDGDVVDLYVNGRLALDSVTLEGLPGTTVQLSGRGPFEIEIHAVNEGSDPPNTAAIRVTNVGSGKETQTIRAHQGEFDSFTITVR